jgi:RNA polymerase sigma-70 factor, ECF subfamily
MTTDDGNLAAAQAGDHDAFERLVAPYLRELRTHCYRMAGSLHDAEDLLQETLLKVWKGLPGFEQRASFRTWLYKTATNVCIDALEKRDHRSLPMQLGAAVQPTDPIGPPRFDPIWLQPCPAEFYASAELSPAAHYDRRQSVALAFLVAIQLLPARQRAVLILHDVLGFQAAECAGFLDLTTAAVNSSLQRARGTLGAQERELSPAPPTSAQSAVLERYVRAWESADVDALVALLLDDATLEMPPLPQWLRGAGAIGQSIGGMVFAAAGPGAFRLVPTEANGQPAFAAYQLDRDCGEMWAMALHVLGLSDGRIASITAFLDPSLLPAFGLPATIPA